MLSEKKIRNEAKNHNLPPHEGNIMIAGLILLKRDIIYKRKNCTRGRCYIPLDSDKHIPLFSTYKFDARIVGRVSQDTTVNSRGRQLLPLCISAGLRILNGRTTGDLLGSYTCYQPQGSSVVDYMDQLYLAVAILAYKYCQQYLYKKVYKYCYFSPKKLSSMIMIFKETVFLFKES